MSEKEKDKKKKSLSTLKSVAQVTKSWGNKLSPKFETKKVKSKVALMKVRRRKVSGRGIRYR